MVGMVGFVRDGGRWILGWQKGKSISGRVEYLCNL